MLPGYPGLTCHPASGCLIRREGFETLIQVDLVRPARAPVTLITSYRLFVRPIGASERSSERAGTAARLTHIAE